MRSIRCIGKKTTAEVKGSPSRTITVRSSNEASSTPLMLSPAGARARIIPQNFSRGLESVAITSAPGENGSCGFVIPVALDGVFSIARDFRWEARALQIVRRFVAQHQKQSSFGSAWESSMLTVMQNESAVIEFRDVSYRVGGTQVIEGLNLNVTRGETLVLLGRSGSGKTTTLKLINRLVGPTAGEVRVNGRPNTEGDVTLLRRGIGYVIQEVGLFPHFTVARNIGLVPKIEGWKEERIGARVEELLQLVGLGTEFGTRYPHQLSGGQRQRVGVARALAADPELLLMDEPFGALDPLTRDELQREFLALQRRLNKTVVFVTHDLREALLLGSRIALMEAGKLVTVLAPLEFVQSTDPWAAAYVRAFGDGLESVAKRSAS